MRRLPLKLALTASIATLLWAVPVSIDLARPSATDPNAAKTIGIGLKIDAAEARVGRPATPRSFAGAARRTARTPYVGAAVVGTAVVGTAAAAARCATVVVDGVAVRRCY